MIVTTVYLPLVASQANAGDSRLKQPSLSAHSGLSLVWRHTETKHTNEHDTAGAKTLHVSRKKLRKVSRRRQPLL